MEARMKVSKTGGAKPARAGSVARAEAAYRSAEAAQPRAVPPPEDVASVVGIPEAELTPKVRQALQQLMADVYALRQELEEEHQRGRSDERRVGKECGSTCRSRRQPEHYKQTRATISNH